MSYFEKNFKFRFDSFLGLRGLGLAGYGVIPASLVYLGVVKIDQKNLPLSIGTLELISFFIVFAMPTLIMFRLVNARVNRYYLIKNYSAIRSVFLTLEIYIGSIAVCLATGVLSGNSPSSLNVADWHEPIIKAFIGATASLAVSSTLISSILANKADLPGMPSVIFEEKISTIKRSVSSLTKGEQSIKWGVAPNKKFLDEHRNTIAKLNEDIYFVTGLIHPKSGFYVFLKQLLEDLAVLDSALQDIKLGANWEKYLMFKPEDFTDSLINKKSKIIERFLSTEWMVL